MRRAVLIGPEAFRNLHSFYNKVVDIQEATITRNSLGEETATWTDVYTDVHAAIGSARLGQELRRENMSLEKGIFRVALSGHYPKIRTKMRMVEGTNVYNILTVLHGLGAVTHLDVEQIL